MTAADLAGIHDILPLETPSPWMHYLGGISLLAIVLIAVFALWRYFHPLSRLARQLKKNQIATRKAAHLLAHQVPADSPLRADIDRLRFTRQPPEQARLLDMINTLRRRHVR